MQLYRGTHSGERRRRLYGFSWTTSIEIARNFATPPHWPGLHGVVLATTAPPGAILRVREEGGYYDEGEVIVDPFRLGKVTVVERDRSATPQSPTPHLTAA
jgi:uncharacterized membrane protein YdbT with pleckstrin-like domain